MSFYVLSSLLFTDYYYSVTLFHIDSAASI